MKFLVGSTREFMSHKFWQLLLVFVLPFALARASQTKPRETLEGFPMSVGTSWTYRGIVRWTHDINKVSETRVEWKMEVRRLIHHGEYTGAIVSGFPTDLDWSDGKVNPTDSLLIQFGQEKFYLIPDERFAKSVEMLENPTNPLKGLLSEDDLFLELPLVRGKKFCDAEAMARPDSSYCWVVDSSKSIGLDKVVGAPRGLLTSYRIRYVTNPDDIGLDFVPGVGLIRYEYHHHGTVADTELKLSAFRPAPSPK
jgi:hypothetical protein